MIVRDVMTKGAACTPPDASVKDAAGQMKQLDVGALPVCDNDRLVGVVTDRDIAVRAVAQHMSPDTLVREVMSPHVLYCYEDDDVDQVARNMGENQVRRLPVLNRSKRLVGIVSLSDLWKEVRPETAVDAVADISKPGGVHSQTHQ